MSEESIFQGTTNTEETVVNTTGIQLPTEVAELVGEGKKYASAEDALKSVPHAQKHIQTLEQELETLRGEVAKRKAVEEVIEEFKQSASKPQSQETPAAQLDETKVAQLVSAVVEKKEQAKVAKENTDKVIAKMTEKFGEKAEQEYIKLAQDNAMPIQMLNALAARSPEAVLKLAGITMSQQTNTVGKPNSSINTEALDKNHIQETPSARVGFKATTKEMVTAWKAAGEKIKQTA